MDEGIKNTWPIYTIEYYSAIKKWNLAMDRPSVDRPRGYYATWSSQTEKGKYHMISLICEI